MNAFELKDKNYSKIETKKWDDKQNTMEALFIQSMGVSVLNVVQTPIIPPRHLNHGVIRA